MKLRNFILGAAATMAFAASFTSCDKDDDSNINLYQTWELKLDADDLDDMDASAMYMSFAKDSVSSYTKFTSESEFVSGFGLSTDTAYLMSKAKLVSAAVSEDSVVAVLSTRVSSTVTREENMVLKKTSNGYVMIGNSYSDDGVEVDTITVVPVKNFVKTDRIRISDLYSE